jgi:hypothetical protein
MRLRTGLFIPFLIPSVLMADTVYLKSGGKVSGRIVTRSETEVEVDVGAGNVKVPMAKVDRVEEGRSALEEYARRAAALGPQDADGWRELARWAKSQSLNTQAHQAYEKVRSISPNDPEANQATGKVQVGGQWVSEEESYRARGYVKFEGEWMTPAEQRSIQQHRSSAAEAERATQRAREAEARAKEAEASAREAEAEDEGIPLYWGWGTGPAAWPGTIVYPGRPTNLPARNPR